jgi:hypothetical protein
MLRCGRWPERFPPNPRWTHSVCLISWPNGPILRRGIVAAPRPETAIRKGRHSRSGRYRSADLWSREQWWGAGMATSPSVLVRSLGNVLRADDGLGGRAVEVRPPPFGVMLLRSFALGQAR